MWKLSFGFVAAAEELLAAMELLLLAELELAVTDELLAARELLLLAELELAAAEELLGKTGNSDEDDKISDEDKGSSDEDSRTSDEDKGSSDEDCETSDEDKGTSDEDSETSDEDDKSSSSVLLEQAKTRREPKTAEKPRKRTITPPIRYLAINIVNGGEWLVASGW